MHKEARFTPSMYLRQLTSRGSSVFPQSRSAVGGFRGSLSTSTPPPPHFIRPQTPSHYIHHHPLPPSLPLIYPWFNPSAPSYPPPLRPARFVYSGPVFRHNYRPFCSSNGLRMERPDREREPPPKRRKSVEEKHSSKLENNEERTNYQYKDRNKDKNPPEKHQNHKKEMDRTKQGEESKTKSYTLPKRWKKKSQSDGSKNEQQKSCGATPGREWTEAEVKEVEGSNPWTVVGEERQTAGINATQTQNSVNVKPLHRLWERSPLSCSDEPQPPGVSASFDFTVMSYNILSQDLLLDNSYLYRHCEPEVLQWEYRFNNILREIQEYNADILCLQEVQEDHFVNQFRPALEAQGYQCEYKKRTGHKSDGCAVFFKRSRLSLLSSNPVEFYRRGDSLLDRDNVGLVVILSPVSDPSSSLVVANTHLLYNPRRGDIKLAQLAILLAELHRLSRPPDGSTNPVLLCGDFNSTPWSPLYKFLTSGHLDFKGLPIGMVSGQESVPRGQRLLSSPLWDSSLGINNFCQYQDKTKDTSNPTSPTVVEGAISELTVEDLATRAAQDILKRWRIGHGLKLQSSYSHRLCPDGREEITTCHSRAAMTVDYILYTPDTPLAESSSSPSLPGGCGLELLGKLSLVGRSELEQVNGLPNQNHSSDHLPLLARFRLKT